MKGSLWGYIKAAFNARPMGMFVAPNWVGVLGVGLLGLLNPGFWLVGAGLELAYLYVLSTNRRFQNYVDATHFHAETADSAKKLTGMLNALGEPDRQRYRLLERRCQAIIEQQKLTANEAFGDLQSQGEGLGKLLWLYLQLLTSRQAFARLLRESDNAQRVGGESPERRAQRIEAQLRDSDLDEDLRKSLSGQLDILRQRAQTQREAEEKLAFLDAELARIEQQVELIREQAVLSDDPATVSTRIDEVAATLTGTSQWIREQQQAYGQVADVLEEPPVVVVGAGRETA